MTLNEFATSCAAWRDDLIRLEATNVPADSAAWRRCHGTARSLLEHAQKYVHALVEVFDLDGELWFTIATTLNCAEANAIAGLLAIDAAEFAGDFLQVHAEGDRSEDDHHKERYGTDMAEVRSGDEIRLLHTTDPFTSLLAGARGTVTSVEDTGTVHVEWDDFAGATLSPDGGDAFVILRRPSLAAGGA